MQVYPELVGCGLDGNVQTVRYQELIPMLLNELQKQAAMLAAQSRQMAAQRAAFEERLSALELVAKKRGPKSEAVPHD